MLVRYLHALWSILRRDRALAVVAIGLALLLLMSLTTPGRTTGGADVLDHYSGEAYTNARLSLSSMQGAGAPDELIDIYRRMVEALERAQGAEVGTREFFSAAADCARAELELEQEGFLSSSGRDTVSALAANAELIVRISQMDSPVIYERVGEEPSLYYLAEQAAQVPHYLWAAPCLVVLWLALSARAGGRLLSHVPAREPVAALASVALVAVTSTGLALAACVPAFLWPALCNGIGDGLYPVVFISGNELVATTVGQVLLSGLALLFLQSLVLASCGELLFQLLDSPKASLVGAAALALVPQLSLYRSAELVGSGVLPWAAPTYFQIPSIVGYPSYFNGADISGIEGVSALLGCGVLLGWLAALLGGALLLSRHRNPTRI